MDQQDLRVRTPPSPRPPAALAAGLRRAGILYPFLILFVVLSISSGPFFTKVNLLDASGSNAEAARLSGVRVQVLPAVPGTLLGIPLGIGLLLAADGGGKVTIPPAWWLAAAVLTILAAVAVMASIPGLIGARVPASQILQSETA